MNSLKNILASHLTQNYSNKINMYRWNVKIKNILTITKTMNILNNSKNYIEKF
jgi:hypothetical protein